MSFKSVTSSLTKVGCQNYQSEFRHHNKHSMHDFSLNPTSAFKEGNSIPTLKMKKVRLGRLSYLYRSSSQEMANSRWSHKGDDLLSLEVLKNNLSSIVSKAE